MTRELLLDSAEYVRSDKDDHFSGAIIQDATEEENIDFPTNWGTMKINKAKILGVTLISDEQRAWDVKFYGKDTFNVTSDLDSDFFQKTLKTNESDGIQEAGANQYYYDLDPPQFPFIYHDEDLTSEFHISLVNRSATAKTAGAAGEVRLIIHAIPIC